MKHRFLCFNRFMQSVYILYPVTFVKTVIFMVVQAIKKIRKRLKSLKNGTFVSKNVIFSVFQTRSKFTFPACTTLLISSKNRKLRSELDFQFRIYSIQSLQCDDPIGLLGLLELLSHNRLNTLVYMQYVQDMQCDDKWPPRISGVLRSESEMVSYGG